MSTCCKLPVLTCGTALALSPAMKKLLILSAILGISVVAFAGKQERDLMTKEVAPSIANAESVLKSKCGCSTKITIDEANITTMDDLRHAKSWGKWVAEGAAKYCTDDASKKAICQMKTVTFTKGKPAGFAIKDGAATATTDGQSTCSWEQMTRALDK